MSQPPLRLIPQHFGSLVFDRRSSRYFAFDQQCTDLLLRLVSHPIEQVVVASSARGEREAGEAIERFFLRFERLGFFALDGRLAARVVALDPPADHLAGPLAVHLEVTNACDLRCSHCFATAGDRPAGNEAASRPPLSLRELDRLFAELAALGCFRLGITGGEPLLRPDLLELLDSAIDHGLVPCVTTNGLHLDEPTARELGARPLAWLNVSLEGADAAANDSVRGVGTFDRVLHNLRCLREHARFTLAFTVTNANAPRAEACAQLAREVGASAAVFRPLYPVGRACAHPHLMPSYEQYTNVIGRLERLARQTDAHDQVLEPFGPLSRASTQARVYRGPGCGAANLVASISCSGVVNPCSFLGPGYDAGSIRRQPFAEIWHRGQVFEQLRSGPGLFEGGCRARAMALSGGADRRDPWFSAASKELR